MRKLIVFGLIVLIASAFLASCSGELKTYNRYVKKGTIQQRDSAAFFFYNRGNYEKAAFLFEELMSLSRGDTSAESYLYHYAYCKYNQHFFVSASYYFEQLTRQFPSSDKAEECAFMIGYCYYQQSDPYYLDQSFTDKALSQFQVFINLYPGSAKIKEANELMTDMREKQAHKSFEQSKLYLKVSNYKAAVEAFQVTMAEYPDSRYREEAQFLLIKAAVQLADNSVISKRKNRYLDALDYYTAFIDKYPNSVFIKEAENLYDRAKRNLGKIQAAENS